MNVTITPAPLHGEIRANPSKSDAHRLLICAALSDAPTRILCPETCEDVDATVRCLTALGAKIERDTEGFLVTPGAPPESCCMDCGESGSTLRFLLPVVCALGVQAGFKLHGRLPERPLEPLWSELKRGGAILEKDGGSIRIKGKLKEIDYALAANISSQFLSGILFALPLLGGGTLKLLGNVESAGYLDLTLRRLADFGVKVERRKNTLTVPPCRYRTPGLAEVEGDWSSAAFWLTAGTLCGNTVRCTGIDPASAQKDRLICDALQTIRGGSAVLDATNIPDLVPILSVAAALTPGTTTITGAERLRLKESDRLSAVSEMLRTLGGEVTVTGDGFVIHGCASLRGGAVNGFGDHRIVMAASIAAVGCKAPVTILGAEAVNKSYPGFFRDYAALGGICKEEAG